MLYFLAHWIKVWFDPPGIGVFHFITFRFAAAAITALIISFWLGPKIIKRLQDKQIRQMAKKELEAVGTHSKKAGTPTMGGLIVLLALLGPTILWADISNIYIILVIFSTFGLGCVGFLDDYLKVVKKLRHGLIARYKLIGQIIIGLILGGTIFFLPDLFYSGFDSVKSFTTVPFAKNINFNFGILYIPVIIFILTAISNAVNLTDGLDGLSIGTVGIVALPLLLISYFSGNYNFADYLNIIYLRGSGELTIFCASLVGAALGFLWFNTYPAKIIMGDTGSLALGGAIATLAILLKKEFLIPILCGIFFAETVSVIIQVLYFKYTKKKYNIGKRVFLMAPIHHHFEKKGLHESQIVIRFYIIAVMLAIITMMTFKIR